MAQPIRNHAHRHVRRQHHQCRGLVTITAIVIYFAAVGGVSLLATLGIWEILDRRENSKRGCGK